MATISTKRLPARPGETAVHADAHLTIPGMGLVEKRLLARDWPQHALAEPPAGSEPQAGDG